MEQEIREIFERITERFEIPIRLSHRCETGVYYHVEDLSSPELELCAQFIAERVRNVAHPLLPSILINLPGGYTDLAATLSTELAPPGESLEIITMKDLDAGNGHLARLKNARCILVNDVITTARSCLAIHSRITMLGASVLCWACLVDRTFGPGPVPVVAAYTGAPVTLLGEIP
ncbi:MAG TPA: phosphoribosyltransferase [Oligoflexia bacterium]|nr:phosphoribosyltransferase [Oligoflexia bacterium]